MSDKIHPATPRRRQRAKEQGRVPRSNDVVSSGLLLAGTALLSWFGPDLSAGLATLLSETLSQPPDLSMDAHGAMRMILRAIAAVGLLVLPLLVGLMSLGIAMNFLQTGWLMTPSKLVPSLDRISPRSRVQQLFSLRAIGRFGITLLKLISIVAVTVLIFRTALPDLVAVTALPIPVIAATLFEILIDSCFWIGLTLMTFACVDYSLARWQHERELMMTEQELRDELRDAERTRPPATARSQAVQGVS